MIKRLRKVGNSNALILDKPILELIGLAENGQVQLTVQNGNLIVTPIDPQQLSDVVLAENLDYIIDKRHDALKRLAE